MKVTAVAVVNRRERIPVLVSHVDGVAVESLAHGDEQLKERRVPPWRYTTGLE